MGVCNLPKNMEVTEIYIEMYWTMFPVQHSCRRVAAKARVSPSYAETVTRELSETGHVLDPEIMNQAWNKPRGIGVLLSTEEEIFLLSLHLEAPKCPNMDYIRQLDQYYGKLVQTNFSSDFETMSALWVSFRSFSLCFQELFRSDTSVL
jgi:hypothetical protein